jgi:PAS domain S-box-containing protein/putative nucleotidyltransferase with HDIG domain
MTRLGALAACIFAVTIPVIYYSSAVTEIRHTLTLETAFLAKSIEQVIQDRPEMWGFENTRLAELASQPSFHGGQDEREIRTSAGTLVVKNDFVVSRPFIEVSTTFFDSGAPVGTIKTRRSILVPMIVTVLLGIFSSLFGCLIYFIFRIYPIRMLDKVLVGLRLEKEKTEKVFQAIGDGIISVDSDGKIQLINRVAELLVGWNASEAVGQLLKDVYVLVGSPENPLGKKANLNILTSREGREYVIEEVRTPVQEIEAGENGIVIIFRDVSGRDEAGAVRRNNKLSIERLRKGLGATVSAIATIVETRDPYTAGHQRRVADLARTIATAMGLAADQIDGIRMAASIHDIGKISVPAEILSKPTKLRGTESELIKDHSQAGYEILKDIDFPWPIARIVLEHHERINGSGYPKGLKGKEILIESKIITVADVVEAIASHRPYRPALGIDIALEEIVSNKGVFYDPEVVDACLRVFIENGYKMKEG